MQELYMALSSRDIANLKKLITQAQTLLREAEGESRQANGSANRARPGGRQRRSGKELLAFRKGAVAKVVGIG
jgi:hypothetical protein